MVSPFDTCEIPVIPFPATAVSFDVIIRGRYGINRMLPSLIASFAKSRQRKRSPLLVYLPSRSDFNEKYETEMQLEPHTEHSTRQRSIFCGPYFVHET